MQMRYYISLRDFSIINKQLEKNPCDSQLVALCCDIIQKEFFAKLEFVRLQQLLRDALRALSRGNALNEPIKFNSIDSNKFMFEMNDELIQTQHPQFNHSNTISSKDYEVVAS
ncbi:5561_t:CDS:2 [Gigaspora margarita]|uniref:5561_t:CDS:1 n=1 Tax=Gigaspora margarita TaxID=4874 RepID=A0ABM8W6B0_GIGMA|nr:5561_t:CDS:2 [Gigaspora margarita]